MTSPLPEGLLDAIAAHDIILLGERHYMLEHQKLLIPLMKSLQGQGRRVLAQEIDQAIGIIVDDYVTGVRNSIPEWALLLNHVLIAGLREYNQTLPVADRIHLEYFDMNHSRDSYQRVLYDHGAFQNEVCFQALFRYGAYELNSVEYRDSVLKIRDELRAQEADFRLSWGSLWYDRVVHMTDVELDSWERRNSGSDAKREDIIYANIEYLLSKYSGKVVINTGGAHAQKKAFDKMGDNEGNWLGVRLNALYGSRVWSMEIIPVRGMEPTDYSHPEPIPIDNHRYCEKNDLLWIIPELYPEKMVYMPFAAEPFLTRKIGVCAEVFVPAETYDALFLYPQVSSIRMR